MADFAAALPWVIHRQPSTHLLILSRDGNAHACQQGPPGLEEHRIHRIQRIGIDKVVNQRAAGLPRVELGMLARWRGINDDDQATVGKQSIKGRAEDVSIDVLRNRLHAKIVDGTAVIQMQVLRRFHVPLQSHILKRTRKC